MLSDSRPSANAAPEPFLCAGRIPEAAVKKPPKHRPDSGRPAAGPKLFPKGENVV